MKIVRLNLSRSTWTKYNTKRNAHVHEYEISEIMMPACSHVRIEYHAMFFMYNLNVKNILLCTPKHGFQQSAGLKWMWRDVLLHASRCSEHTLVCFRALFSIQPTFYS